MENTKNVIDVITDEYDNLFPTEKKIATYIKNNPREVIMLNVSELAKRSGASEATVVRMCKHLGYQGYYQMRLILSRDVGRKEIQNPNNSDEDLLNWVFEQHIHNLHSLISKLDNNKFIECSQLLSKCRVAHIAAIGNTTPIALDLSFRLGRFGISTFSSPIPEFYLNSVALGNENDVLIAISKSGMARQVLHAATTAKNKGMKIILITEEKSSPLVSLADYILSSNEDHPLFSDFGAPSSHLNELAICDALLFFIKNEKQLSESIPEETNNHIQDVELLISDSKL